MSAWHWNAVAGEYAALIANGTFTALAADPFQHQKRQGAGGCAAWHGSKLVLFDGGRWDLGRRGLPVEWQPGVFALYADVDIQARHASYKADPVPAAAQNIRSTLQRVETPNLTANWMRR